MVADRPVGVCVCHHGLPRWDLCAERVLIPEDQLDARLITKESCHRSLNGSLNGNFRSQALGAHHGHVNVRSFDFVFRCVTRVPL